MRVPFWLFFSLVVSIIIMDITTVWLVRSRIVTAMEHSLDGALIGGITERNAQEGIIYINEDGGRYHAVRLLKRNLNLNDSLENQFLRNTEVSFELENRGEKAVAYINVSTRITAMSPKILGIEGIPIIIRKAQYFVNRYK